MSMKIISIQSKLFVFLLVMIMTACNQSSTETKNEASSNGQTADGMDRTALPIAEPVIAEITELDAHNVKAPPIFEVKAPKGAPNVMVILLDNFGYAGSKLLVAL